MLSYSEANSPYQLTNSLTLQLVNWSTASDKESISPPLPLVRLVGVIGWMKGKHKMHTYYI